MFGDHSVREMDEAEAFELLSAHTHATLAVVVDQAPDLFPIDYRVLGDRIAVLTSAGTKLEAVALNPNVALGIEGADPGRKVAWSVVVKGGAAEATAPNALAEFTDAGASSSLDLPRYRVLVITPASVTGRYSRLA